MLQPEIESAAGYLHGGVGASPLGEGGSDPLVINTGNWCIPCVPDHLCLAFQHSTSIKHKDYGEKHKIFWFGYFIINSLGLAEKISIKASVRERHKMVMRMPVVQADTGTATGFWDNPSRVILAPQSGYPHAPQPPAIPG